MQAKIIIPLCFFLSGCGNLIISDCKEKYDQCFQNALLQGGGKGAKALEEKSKSALESALCEGQADFCLCQCNFVNCVTGSQTNCFQSRNDLAKCFSTGNPYE